MAPQNYGAWILDADKPLEVGPAPYNKPDDNEVVIKAHAWAINPIDPRQAKMGILDHFPCMNGLDVAGTIVEVGAGPIGDFEVGDRVLGTALFHVTKDDRHAAFQMYPTLRLPQIAKIPEHVKMEEAVVLPIAVDTASACLFQKDYLALSMPPSSEGRGKTLLLWGGSSSVGVCSIMLAVASGYEVIAVASKRNHDLVLSLGASRVFDQSDADIVEQLVNAVKGKEVVGAVDAISNITTLQSFCKVLSKVGGRQFIAGVKPHITDAAIEGVEIKMVLGTDVALNEVGRHIWGTFVTPALADGTLKCKPDALVAGHGLGDIQKGMDVISKGVSAAKVIVLAE